MSLAKTTGVVFVIRIVAVVLQAVGLIYFARVLGATLFGIFILFQAVLLFCSFIADLGIDGALEKRVSEGYGGHAVGSATAPKAVVLVVIAASIVLFRGPINSYLGMELALFLVPVLVVQQTGQIVRKVLHGELRVDEAELLKLLRRTLFLAAGVVFVFFGAGVRGLIVSLFGSWVVFCLTGLYMIDTHFAWPTMGTVRSLFEYSKYNFVASVVGGYMYSWMDTLLIGLFLTQSHVAAYEIAWRVVGIVMLLSQSIGQTIFPQISDWDARGQRDKIVGMIPNALTGTLILVFPAIAGVVLLSTDILRYVFGPDFVIASTALIVLMISKLPEGANVVFGRVLLGIDRPDLAAIAVGLFIVLNLVLNVVLINLIGITGAAIATSLSFAVNAGVTAYYLNRELEIRIHWRDLATITLASIVMGAVIFVTQQIVPVTSLVAVVGMVGFGAVLYLSLLLLSPAFRQKFRSTAGALAS